MKEIIGKLLENPAVAGAIAALVVAGVNWIIAWIKSKLPEQVVERYWPYLQPAIEGAFDWLDQQAKAGKFEAAHIVISKTLDEFARRYSLHERAPVDNKTLTAARNEIIAAYNSYIDKAGKEAR